MQKSKVLISGATGWLGRELLNIFSETNFEKIQINLISSKNGYMAVKGNNLEVKSFKNYKGIESVNNYFDFAFLARNKLEKLGPDKFKEINMEIISNSTNLIKTICPKTVVLSSSGAIYNIKKSTKAGTLYSDLKKIQEELHAIGNSHLTRKELNAEFKAFKNRVKSSEEIKADMFHAMGN